MSTNTTTTKKPTELYAAWHETLPRILNDGDSVKIQFDEANSSRIRITIHTAGHSGYTFDFTCLYVDDREVKVEFIDVEKDGIHVDEHTEIIQTLIEDYIRHIHECAQTLQRITHH